LYCAGCCCLSFYCLAAKLRYCQVHTQRFSQSNEEQRGMPPSRGCLSLAALCLPAPGSVPASAPGSVPACSWHGPLLSVPCAALRRASPPATGMRSCCSACSTRCASATPSSRGSGGARCSSRRRWGGAVRVVPVEALPHPLPVALWWGVGCAEVWLKWLALSSLQGLLRCCATSLLLLILWILG
jgi:hypothetical protein